MKNRRKAINCILVEENTETGYHRYLTDIKNTDGSIEVNIPAYGIDMTDALDRILKKERKEKITNVYVNKVEPTMMITIVIAWIVSIALSLINTTHPEYAFYGTISMISIIMIYSIITFFNNINKN